MAYWELYGVNRRPTDYPDMNPALSKLRVQIQECEEFVALCQRIKQLEKLQDGQLPAKKVKLEADRVEICNQLNQATAEHEHLQSTLNDCRRPMGAVEKEELNELIKDARIRVGSLQIMADNATKQIERIDADLASHAQELEQLYQKLEDGIRFSALDPNTIEERLAELRRERDTLAESLKSEITARTTSGKPGERGGLKQPPPEGMLVPESDFYESVLADFAQARAKIEIITPYVQTERAGEIMTELAQLAAKGRNVIVYTRPPAEQQPDMRAAAQNIIADAHRLRITVIQRSGLEYNAAIIDNFICWEGGINILGTTGSAETMRRTVGSTHVRKLRHFLFSE